MITINAAQLTQDQWAQLNLSGSVQSVTMGTKPVVNFTVTDRNGTPIIGLGTGGFTSKSSTALAASYNNFAFTIAKLVPGANGSPSKWVNYIVTTMPTSTTPYTPTRPSTDNTGTLVDHGDGTYTYTFYRDISQMKAQLDAYTGYNSTNIEADLGDVSYDTNAAKLTHRVAIQVGGAFTGTGRNTPDGSTSSLPSVPVKNYANLIYDFIPATGQPVASTDAQRDIVDMASCNSCHSKLAFHSGARVKTEYCTICHTDQRKYGRTLATQDASGNYTSATTKVAGPGTSETTAIGNFPVMIHKIHMGEELRLTGYGYPSATGVQFNDVAYPQDQRNCTKCHTSSNASTPQGDNWMNVPTRAYCGACHDNVNFATGANHTGGTQIDDSLCVSCHGAAGVQISHTPLVAPDAANFLPGSHTNGSYIATDVTNLKALGAHRVTWDLKSFSVNSAGNPVFLFRFLEDGQAKSFNTASSTVTSFWDNYVGGPSFYVALGVPQDNISSPADWNAFSNVYFPNVWNGSLASKATLSATPDSNGYYTLTMVGTVIPAGATQVTGGIGYVYSYSSMPLTQTAVKKFGQIDFTYNPVTKLGGLSVPAPNVFKTATGYTARRAIVDSAKCNSCHNSLGVFTKAVFHAGERNSAETCTFCHHANYVGDHGSDGWADNEKDMIHALHAAPVRNNYFSWQAANGATYWTTTWPGGDGPSMLNNCEVCHVPGSYDFSGTANAAAVPNLLWSTAAIGATPTSTFVFTSTSGTTIPTGATVVSPFVTAGTNYGNAFSYNLATATPTPAAGTTLVHSPIASACFGCHDSQIDIAHFQNNGGSIYQPRSTAFNNVEQCLVCHGNGKVADIKAVHMNF